MTHPDPTRDIHLDPEPASLPAAADVRIVLESAADVIFSDGVSGEFLDQWTFETLQLLEARAARTRRPVSAGR